MKRPAILTGSMMLPIERINVMDVTKAMTISYLPMGAEEPLELKNCYAVEGYLCVPRQYGLDFCRREGIEYEDQTAAGQPAKFPKIPVPREYQVEALQSISECMDRYYDFVFRARTGWGKTIGSLIVAARRGVSTLIIVDQENLKDQWIESLVTHFGFKAGDIGTIQGKKCEYEGKAVTIAMVQTLSQKRFPQEVYDYFGLMIIDEVHTIGAPTFSTVLLDFSASYRMGVSATPKRPDGLQKVLDYSLGRTRVYIADQHGESDVYILEHGTVYSWYANTSPKMGRFINEVTEDGSRNLLVAEAIAHLYDTGRDILILSDRIEQLRDLKSLCYYLGIPNDEMGLYAGYNPVYGYEKNPTPARRPANLERGAEYTPVHLNLISKRIKKTTLEAIKKEAKVIFATYGMFAKGVDVPRLSGGIDASPRSKAEQMQGRILRNVKGKMTPLWVTVVDTGSYRSMFALAGRVSDYATNNSVISKWLADGSKVTCDEKEIRHDILKTVKVLKSSRIGTSSDGQNTLETPTQAMESVRQRVRATRPADPPSRSSAMVSSRRVRPER